MKESLKEKITQSRLLLHNPYAYIDGEGGYDAAQIQDDLKRRISQSRLILENPYAYLSGNGGYGAIGVEQSEASAPFEIEIDNLRNPNLLGKPVSFEQIEGIAKRLQVTIWINRKAIWGENASNDPFTILEPGIAFGVLGYNFVANYPLGEMNTPEGMVEVAGIIDESKRSAGVSSQIPLVMRQFTAAHELGHALLHRAEGLHRDRGLDGSPIAGQRERIEVEADKFATYFLMPTKLLIAEFEARFGATNFIINDDTSFALIADSSDSLKKQFRNRRGLSRILASTDHYNGKRFESIADRFRVSIEAMAIRLEELRLVEF